MTIRASLCAPVARQSSAFPCIRLLVYAFEILEHRKSQNPLCYTGSGSISGGGEI